MSTLIIGPAPHVVKPQSPAARLSPEERKGLAVKVLARTDPVTALAEQNGVSRKFLYVQATKAKEALQDAFDPASNEGDSRVLFYIPVTKQWLVQLVLALVLICRSSIRGVCEFFGAILDSKTSIGTMHSILHHAALAARRINEQEDLSCIHVGAHDEIFQAEKPVLVGAEPASTYCHLLAFAQTLDQDLEAIARSFKVSTVLICGVYERQGLPDEDTSKWQRHAHLRAHLGHVFHPIQETVKDILATTVRASSIIENLNSRLRNYFFLRRHLNQLYLDLLRYFLNHRRLLRSERPERAGKSPVEILTGRTRPHWLEQLGCKLFRRAA